LGASRVDPEWTRFRAAADVFRYLADLNGWTHAELAQRCGVRREQVTRWLNRDNEPTLARLAETLEPLGWTPLIMLARTEDALIELHRSPPPLDELLEYPVRAILGVVADAVESGLDVVVGGEVAAVLQGVPTPTRQLVLHLRPEHRERFAALVCERWMSVEPLAVGRWQVRSGPVTAEIRLAPVRPASRIVGDHDQRPIPVVDLEELMDDPRAISSSVRTAAGRLLDRAG
jgi:transcriptional regulator with XRE-family HTH domain